jgi:ribosomal protein S27AE
MTSKQYLELLKLVAAANRFASSIGAENGWSCLREFERGNVRACGKCGEWFLAKRQEQKWCSGRCRQAMYQGTETFKKTRRNRYARQAVAR